MPSSVAGRARSASRRAATALPCPRADGFAQQHLARCRAAGGGLGADQRRRAAGHGFLDRERQAFAHARQHQQVGGLVERGQLLVAGVQRTVTLRRPQPPGPAVPSRRTASALRRACVSSRSTPRPFFSTKRPMNSSSGLPGGMPSCARRSSRSSAEQAGRSRCRRRSRSAAAGRESAPARRNTGAPTRSRTPPGRRRPAPRRRAGGSPRRAPRAAAGCDTAHGRCAA